MQELVGLRNTLAISADTNQFSIKIKTKSKLADQLCENGGIWF